MPLMTGRQALIEMPPALRAILQKRGWSQAPHLTPRPSPNPSPSWILS